MERKPDKNGNGEMVQSVKLCKANMYYRHYLDSKCKAIILANRVRTIPIYNILYIRRDFVRIFPCIKAEGSPSDGECGC